MPMDKNNINLIMVIFKKNKPQTPLIRTNKYVNKLVRLLIKSFNFSL